MIDTRSQPQRRQSIASAIVSKKAQMIPVFKPLIGDDTIEACSESLKMGWLGMGSYVCEFEKQVAICSGATDKHVVAVNTATSGLHLALLLIGAGPGDEVIISAFNMSADYQAISWSGADIVFCDCTDKSLELDLEKAEKLVSKKTKAIIVMDYDCIISDHDKIASFAKAHNLRVIHDASHSFGSFYKNQPIGSFSDITVFSHDPVKTVTCLDGGSIIVNTIEERDQLREMRLLGMQQPSETMYKNARAWTYDVERIGYRYHMLNLHAAVGLSQLAKLELIRNSRQNSCRLYNKLLQDITQIILPDTDFANVNPFLYYIRVEGSIRDELRAYLKNNGIDTGIHWQPGNWFTLWKNVRQGDLSVVNEVGKTILSLPLHSCMSDEDVTHVCTQIISFYSK